ncbi:MAG: flippase-like domain-containing protein [Prevotellaceae bacterium]|jgi:uncharacterized protein (TIRG00374 family)|nr:flippase-like domain-containing protein [Prevotellaceae bacterium]
MKQSKTPAKNAFSGIKGYKIIFPIIIGIGVVVYLFWGELYPQPSFRPPADHSAIELKAGDTVLVESNHLAYSDQKMLSTNVPQLVKKTHIGDVLYSNSDSAFVVFSKSDCLLICQTVNDIEISGGDVLTVEKHRLRAYGVVDVLREIKFTWRLPVFIFLALLCMLGRDFGYMVRIRLLSEKALGWMQSFRIIMLWEFTSAITPSAIGGTSVAVLYVNKEGIPIGRSSAIVMATSLLDEVYFVIMFPLLLLIISSAELFDIDSSVATGLMAVTLTGYFIKLAWVLGLGYGMFFNAKGLKWILVKIFSLPFLRRWKKGAEKAGDDIVISSVELKHKPFRFWLKAFGATFVSWTSRYWVVNMLFMAFFTVHDHFLIFTRQLVMWIMMLVSPTPGGSGFAEYVFKEFLGEFIPVTGLVLVIALLWRLISYYLYLIIGVFVVPSWINSKFGKPK